MQRDRGLAGAGTAGDDQHAGQVGADRLVLLGLDRGDDVAHAAGAVAFERGEQRALAHDRGSPTASAASWSNTSSSRPTQLAALRGEEVPAAHDAHRLDRGRPVERLGDRRAPVDDERGLVVVGDRDAADVVPVAVGGGAGVVGLQVEAAEHQRGVADLEVGQAALGVGDGDVALEPGLVGPAPAHLGVALGDPPGGRPHLVEPVVGPVDVALLGRELGGSAAELEGARAGEGDPGAATRGLRRPSSKEPEPARATRGPSSGVVAGSAVDSRGSSGTRSPREGANQLTGRATSAQPIRSSAAP